MSGKQDSDGRRQPQAGRAERLAAALRANLKRRKMQARGRAEGGKPACPGEEPPQGPEQESRGESDIGRKKPGN